MCGRLATPASCACVEEVHFFWNALHIQSQSVKIPIGMNNSVYTLYYFNLLVLAMQFVILMVDDLMKHTIK
jgi:hypothetical protein